MEDTNTDQMNKRLQDILAVFLVKVPPIEIIAAWMKSESEELQDFVGMHLIPSVQWSTAIGIIEAAQNIVLEAINNANLTPEGVISG